MNKTFRIVFFAAIVAFVLNLLFGRILAAKVSTWPFLNRLKILSPQAPIVINQREEIRITENGQLDEAVSAAKSKISAVYLQEPNGNIKFMGPAVNLTSEGEFVAFKEVFSGRGDYFVFLEGGRNASVGSVVSDPASGLIFFRAGLESVPVAALADSKSLFSGEKVFVFSNNFGSAWQGWASYLTRTENERGEKVFTAGLSQRSFELANQSDQEKGKIILNSRGEVVGIAAGKEVVPSDVLKSAMVKYLNNKEKIVASDYDFAYTEVYGPKAAILKTSSGSLVVSSTNPALKVGDVIVSAGGLKLGGAVFLEEILEKYEIGQEVSLGLVRAGQNIDVKIKGKELR
ncbi:MAG: serine protease [Candidatus Doudnabacteria bacterium]|nr:serine protease [Candidatus Doudnabacteria bacterium]